MNLEELSLSESFARIRSGEVSPVELVRALLARIDSLEPFLRAWVTIDRDAALAEARRCEVDLRNNSFRGPLHGIPIGLKDIFFTRGLRTTAGSRIFADFVPDRDARAVQKLKEAGAIILGKTVTAEFATFDPGPTRNPWNLEHTPGGSSSGSAAAVAARMCAGATGSQTIGSTGRPAAYCGVVGFVPTASRISRSGVFPVSWTLDHVGVFCRSVADAGLLLASMSESEVEQSSAKQSPRIGVLRQFFWDQSSEETRTVSNSVLASLSSAGALVDEVRLPPIFEMAAPVLMTIMRAEVAAVHEKLFAAHRATYGPQLRALVESGSLIHSLSYLRARRIRRKYIQAMLQLFKGFDVLVTPGAPRPAPKGLSSTGDRVMNGPWTLAGFPTITLPCAVASDGMPLALQVIAPPLKEGILLHAARWCEDVVGFRHRPTIRGSEFKL